MNAFSYQNGRAVSLLAAFAAFFCVFLVPAPAIARETVAQSLLRTLQIGVPQGLTVDQIRKVATSNDTDYTTEILARSALVVLRQDDAKLIPYTELLDNHLSHLVSDGTPFQPLRELPGFRGRETLFAMVYAMVMSGNQQRAVDILEKHSLTGSRYKQAVVLSALRNIGTPRALGIIQQYAEKGSNRNLAETTLADEDYPVLSEVYDRWNLVPPTERTQDNLRAIVQAGCNQRGALAAYWLGFFAPNIDPNKETAELQALEKIASTNTSTCEMMEHVIALKSLGLRSRETVDYWKRLAEHTPNVWERHQVILDAFGRWGRSFAPAALDLLKTDPAQYVEWELLNGNLETRQGRPYRNYWDIWIPADVLVVLESDQASGHPSIEQKDLDAMVGWLDAGARPRDPVVLNHLLYHLVEFTSGDETRRLLRVFDALAQRNQNWWVLQTLRDPAALPLLRYWSTLPAPADQKLVLEQTIANLASRTSVPASSSRACCDATEECLLEQLKRGGGAAPVDAQIRSEEDAHKWLAEGGPPETAVQIRYTDELKRSAIVRHNNGEEHWQYLYDCWRNTDTVAPH